MATSQEFIDYVCGQIQHNGIISYKKMFGEYMVYVNAKPLLLVCDNTVFVKKLDSIKLLCKKLDKGFPYPGAKEHYIIDVDDRTLLNEIIQELEKVIPIPVKKKSKK